MTTEADLREAVADEWLKQFDLGKRDDGSEFWSRKGFDHDDALASAIREAHGDSFPDDHVYAEIVAALDLLAATGPDDWGDIDGDVAADIYTYDRLKWFTNAAGAIEACDEAMEDFGVSISTFSGGIAEMIGLGQAAWKRRICQVMRNAVEQEAGRRNS